MTFSDGMHQVTTRTGGSMPAHVARPAVGHGPGVLVLHEIFGITDYLKRRARDLADLGYIAVIPDLYWRMGDRIVLAEDTQEGLQQAFGYLQRLDEAQAVDDAIAAFELLKAAPETDSQVGVLGFCMGGRLAYKLAARAEPDAVVSYYGSGIGALLEDAPKIQSPILFHFGTADAFLPLEEAESIRAAFAAHTNAEVELHEGAGHAFDNPSPMFHHARAAREAWPQTTAFLRRTLGPAR
ncbi:MAG: dienelactone hydrolase family protein [Chloroflexota bacterium]|nr:dienelactone hydrolase family protein [Chloroflexota bacterium]